MPDVNVFGKKLPRGPLIFGAVAAAGVGIYVYIKHKNAAASASPATFGYGYGYGGYGYGGFGGQLTPEELAEEGAYPYGYGGYPYGYGSGIGVGVGSPFPVTGTVAPVATNAAWAQAAEQELEGNGYDPTTVAAALGKYITGGTVTADQQSIIQAAIAFEGYPPQPGANNYPPNIHTQTSPGQSGGSGGGTTSATQVKIPVTFGEQANAAISKLQAAGFKVRTSPTRNPKNTYTSTGTSPEGGKTAAKGSTVTLHVKVQKKG